jgi:predicted DNA-binding transcriptional regulator YafY
MAKTRKSLASYHVDSFFSRESGNYDKSDSRISSYDGKNDLERFRSNFDVWSPSLLSKRLYWVYLEEDRIHIQFAQHFKRPIRLNLDEALALRMALASFPLEEDSPYRNTLNSLLQKIETILPEWEQNGFNQYPSIFQDKRKPIRSQILHTLEQGLKESKVCEIVYFSPNHETLTTRQVEVLGLLFHDGLWYLIGYCYLREKTLAFRLDRMKTGSKNGKIFRKKEVDLEAFKKSGLLPDLSQGILATLWFHKNVARYIQEEFPQESLEVLPQGHIELKMRIASPRWLFSWLVEYGPLGRIVSPDSLAQDYRKQLEATLQHYPKPLPLPLP